MINTFNLTLPDENQQIVPLKFLLSDFVPYNSFKHIKLGTKLHKHELY